MRLVDNWRKVLERSWSVRFQLIQAVGVGLLTGIYGYTMGWELWLGTLFCLASVAFSCMGIVARIIWQKDFHPGAEACDADQ
jgi:hypothetical protein